ncbi:MAG: nuclear transport factor 2 family protein [Rhodoferax sp.]|nr:nuclear transport factor 2 family protein [Rhodoferax sp.]
MARFKPQPPVPGFGATAEEVEAAFYEGMQTGDIEKVMACWADEDDIVCIYPGSPRMLGVHAIRTGFEALFANGTTVQIFIEHVHHIDAASSSVRHVLERAEVSTPQGTVQAYVLASNVYHQTAQGWRMVLHHASLGQSGRAAEVTQSPKILH